MAEVPWLVRPRRRIEEHRLISDTISAQPSFVVQPFSVVHHRTEEGSLPMTDARSKPSRAERATARIAYLNGRAAALRKVADTIDIRSIRDRVLALAEECLQLARLVEIEGHAKSSELTAGRRPRRLGASA